MSILDCENKLLNELPVKFWLDEYLQLEDAYYEICYDEETDTTLVNILPNKNKVVARVSFKSRTPNIPTSLFKFNLVDGTMFLKNLNWTTLEGMPNLVTEGLTIYNCNGLKNLIGCPKKIGGDFRCSACWGITDFIAPPEYVNGTFECQGCLNLENARYTGTFGSLIIQDCPKLKYIPQFPKYFIGFIDISNCGNLDVKELTLLPDIIEGNLYLKHMCFKLEKVGLSEVKQVKDQNGTDYAIPFTGVGGIFKDENDTIIKYVQVNGDIYD